MAITHNFECPDTGEKFYIPKYTIGFDEDLKIYCDKKGRLVNPKNGAYLIPYSKEFGGFGALGKFSMQSRDGQVKAIKERANKHTNSLKKKKGKIY